MSTIAVDGRTVEYIESGVGDAVVFSSPTWWPLDAWRLSGLPQVGAAHRAIAFNHRGVGASSSSTLDGYDVTLLAKDLIAFLDALGIESVALVSFAIGTGVALRVADLYPGRVRALVLGAGGGGAPASAPSPRAAEAADIEAHGFRAHIEEHALNDTYAFDPQTHALHPERPKELARALWEHSAPAEEYLKHVDARRGYDAFDFARRISVPSLVVVGGADTVARGVSTPLAASHRLVETLLQSELFVVPRVRHMLYWEEPDAVWPRVLEFLARTAPV